MMLRWLKILASLAALSMAFALALALIDDPDVWWHLKCGELFVRKGWIPRSEIFSYTAEGAPWVDGYILAQALMYLCWWVGDETGVCLFVAIAASGAYALALAVCRRSGPGYNVALALSFPAVLLARVAMIPRPSALTPLFALAALWLLEDNRKLGGRRVYWLIPLTAAWANSHPGFVMAPAFTAIYIVGAVFGGRFAKTGAQTAAAAPRHLWLALAGQLLATLVNPYGYRIYYSIAAFLTRPEVTGVILEWRPLFGEPGEPPGIIPCFLIVVAAWAACVAWAGRRAPLALLLMFIFMAVSTITGRRNLILFGPVSIPLIAWTVGEASAAAPWPFGGAAERWRELGIKTGMAVFIVTGFFMTWFVATNRFSFYLKLTRTAGVGAHTVMFPAGAADLVEHERPRGNLLNYYQAGGYLIFKLYPEYRVYMDGRFYPYPSELFEIENDPEWFARSFQKTRARYGITGVLIPIYPPKAWPALWGFIRSRDWATVQADGYGVLFLARGVGNDDIINRLQIDLEKSPPPLALKPPGRELGFFDRAEYPFGPIRWAMFYEKTGRPDLAAMALGPALNYRPQMEFIVSWRDKLLKKAQKY